MQDEEDMMMAEDEETDDVDKKLGIGSLGYAWWAVKMDGVTEDIRQRVIMAAAAAQSSSAARELMRRPICQPQHWGRVVVLLGPATSGLARRLRYPDEKPRAEATCGNGVEFGECARLLSCNRLLPPTWCMLTPNPPCPHVPGWMQLTTAAGGRTTIRTVDVNGAIEHSRCFSAAKVYLLCFSADKAPEESIVEKYIRTLRAAAPQGRIIVVATKCDSGSGHSKDIQKVLNAVLKKLEVRAVNGLVHPAVIETSAHAADGQGVSKLQLQLRQELELTTVGADPTGDGGLGHLVLHLQQLAKELLAKGEAPVMAMDELTAALRAQKVLSDVAQAGELANQLGKLATLHHVVLPPSSMRVSVPVPAVPVDSDFRWRFRG